MPKQRVFSRIMLLVLGAVCLAAGIIGWKLLTSGDPTYAVYELVFHSQFHRFDADIQEMAKSHGVDPMLVKAVVWRESRFRPGKVGSEGERGLMQITDAAAGEWAKSEKIASFVPADLFNPRTNIQAGSWILAKALRRYQDRDDPVPFALAEYNAGRSRVARWAGDREKERDREAGIAPPPMVGSRQLRANIDIPSTKHYVETVLDRVRYYHERGRL